MSFVISIVGTNKPHALYANGNINVHPDQLQFKLTYPSYFTASSGFYHLAPKNSFEEMKFDFTSSSGKNIPVLIYGKANSTNFEEFKSATVKTLQELEADYGSFPHPKVVIYNNGRGGMEYCGVNSMT